MADSTINIFGSSGEAMVGADTINTILASMDSKLTSDDINIETLGDGTVDVDVKNDTYTINLNHTHEDMVKLEKFVESNPPASMTDDKIYVQVDDLTTPTEIEALHIFGLEFTGGGLPAGTPQITSPKSTIPFNLGTAYGQGGATGTVQVKGKNLTANSSLTVSVGSGFSLSYGQQSGSSITISAADATIGADVDVFATAYVTTGTLLIASQTDNISHAVDLTSNIELAGVKLTGTQWGQTDFVPTANTDIQMKMKLTTNENTTNNGDSNFFLTCYTLQGTNKQYALGVTVSGNAPIACVFNPIVSASTPVTIEVPMTEAVLDNSILTFTHNGTFRFVPGGSGTGYSGTLAAVVAQVNPLTLGLYHTSGGIDQFFDRYDLTVYELKVTDNGTVVRNYVPMRREGVPGLYDTITGHFMSSKSSTDFVEIS